MIGIERGYHSLDGVMKQHGAYADRLSELKVMGTPEERLILPHRVAFIVEYPPPAADPSGSDHRRAGVVDVERTGFGLKLLLDLAPQAIGIRKAVLDSGLPVRR